MHRLGLAFVIFALPLSACGGLTTDSAAGGAIVDAGGGPNAPAPSEAGSSGSQGGSSDSAGVTSSAHGSSAGAAGHDASGAAEGGRSTGDAGSSTSSGAGTGGASAGASTSTAGPPSVEGKAGASSVAGSAGASSGGANDGSAGSASAAGAPMGGGLPPGYHLLGAYWDGAVERVDVIDPTTGSTSFVGVLGDLQSWTGNVFLDATGTHVYALGQPANGPYRLYVLDLATGVSTQVPAMDGWLAGVASDGHAIALVVDPTSLALSAVSIDPTSGAMTTPAMPAIVDGGSPEGAFDVSSGVAYSPVDVGSGPTTLAAFDLTTGATTMLDFPSATDGFLSGIDASGRLVEIIPLDLPGTARVTALDVATHTVTAIASVTGVAGFQQIGGTSFDRATSRLYLQSGDAIVTVDLTTSQSTTVPLAGGGYFLARQ